MLVYWFSTNFNKPAFDTDLEAGEVTRAPKPLGEVTATNKGGNETSFFEEMVVTSVPQFMPRVADS